MYFNFAKCHVIFYMGFKEIQNPCLSRILVDHPGVVDMRNIPESFHARMTAVMQLQQE
jgi:hypothetical protein